MAKTKVVFFCKECGYESPKWLGRCPGCEAWNSFTEEKVIEKKDSTIRNQVVKSEVQKLSEIEVKDRARFDTGYDELNRVLGGGIVDGSLILLGGDQTTPNMIQRISEIFERKPFISKEI